MKSRGFQRQIILDTESCPSWPKEHDWKSCSASTSTRGFESLALRQKRRYESTVFYFCARDSNQGEMVVAPERRQNHQKKVRGTFFRVGYPEGLALRQKRRYESTVFYFCARDSNQGEMVVAPERRQNHQKKVRGTFFRVGYPEGLALRQKRRYESTAFIFSRTMCLPVALVSLI